MPRNRPSLLLALAAALASMGCRGGGSDPSPRADAGPDQERPEGALVLLEGTASAPGSAVASVLWTQSSGPAVALADGDTTEASFIAPQAPIGEALELEFTFTVTDTAGKTDSDRTRVRVTSADFIVFVADKETAGFPELYLADVETGALGKLSTAAVGGPGVSTFAISPDGQHVAYWADQDTPGVVERYCARTDGIGSVKLNGALVAGGKVGMFYRWAPDGVLELYSSRSDGTDNARVNGPLAPGGAVGQFAWSPDASRVAWLADQDVGGVLELYVARPDGSDRVELSGALVLGGSVRSFQWRP